MENIHPIFNTILQGSSKETMLGQKAVVVWMVGLSGSGKSTLARALENRLHEKGILTALLDGDNLRTGVNKNLGFSAEDRVENIRRAAEVSKLFASNGVVTICSLISPTHEIRRMSKEILGDHYVEVFIECPLEVCEERDVKGLYKKARQGLIPDFTGIDSPFEDPDSPDIRIPTHEWSIEESLDNLFEEVYKKVKK